MNIRILFILHLILIIHSSKTIGQSRCNYSHNWGYANVNIELSDSNKFIYHFNNCTSSEKGYGKYRETEKELVLSFETVPDQPNSSVKKIDSTLNRKNKCIIYIRLLNEKGNSELAYATVTITDSGGNRIGGVRTNKNGIAKFIINPSDQLAYLHVSSLGYKKFTLPVSLNRKTFRIEINLAKAFRIIYIEGHVMNYKIRKKTNNTILLSVGDDDPIKYKISCY